MGVSLQMRKGFDRIARGAQLSAAVWAAGTEFWPIIDAAQDETYENAVETADITAMDDALAAGPLFGDARLKKWFTAHNTYFSALGLTGGLATWLSTVGGFRVPYLAAEAYYQALGARLAAQHIFPKGTLVASEADPASAGMHKFGRLTGTATYADVDGALDTDIILAAAVLCVSAEATPGDSSLVMTFTLQDGTTKDIAVVPSASEFGQVIVGQQAITSVAGAVFGCAATAQFKAGEYVLLYENADGDSSLREIAQIKANGITANTSVEFTAAPVNTFSGSGYIVPMFSDVAYKSGTITSGKHLDFFALPDRIIAM